VRLLQRVDEMFTCASWHPACCSCHARDCECRACCWVVGRSLGR
jgi:hypothetical protein